jgi:hypothetical protein
VVRRGRPDVDVARDVVRTKIYDVRGKGQKHRRLNVSVFFCFGYDTNPNLLQQACF